MPYVYQWFSKAPNTSDYEPVSNATSANYNFSTSKSTSTGNWSFKLQITDATGTSVNSTALSVVVNIDNSLANVSIVTIGAVFLALAVVAALYIVIIKKRRT